MKDPMKSRDKITQKNEPRRADRAKPDHGRKRAYQQAHTGRGFSGENAGAASRTGRGAASRGAFHVLLLCPMRRSIFQSRRTQPPSASWSISARDRPGKPRKKLSGERRKRQRQRRSRPVCNLPTRNGQRRSWKSTSRNRTKPPTVWTQRGRHFPQRRNRGCNLTSRKRRRASRASAIPYPAPRRKPGFSSITRYIPWRKTIPALRGRTNPRKPPSAWENTVSERSKRATVATS